MVGWFSVKKEQKSNQGNMIFFSGLETIIHDKKMCNLSS